MLTNKDSKNIFEYTGTLAMQGMSLFGPCYVAVSKTKDQARATMVRVANFDIHAPLARFPCQIQCQNLQPDFTIGNRMCGEHSVYEYFINIYIDLYIYDVYIYTYICTYQISIYIYFINMYCNIVKESMKKILLLLKDTW